MRSEEDYHRAHLRELLRGQYHIEGFLGEGASSIVFRVTNRRLGRLEAIKVLKSKAPDDPSFTQRFIQEAKLCAALDHPHIVKVYDFGAEEGGLLVLDAIGRGADAGSIDSLDRPPGRTCDCADRSSCAGRA